MMKKRWAACLCLFGVLCSLFSCDRSSLHTSRVYAMGTYCTLTEVLSKREDGDASPLFVSLLTDAEELLSHKKDGSVPNLLNELGYAAVAEERLLAELLLAEEIKEKTGGLFSVSVLPITSLWNFGGDAPTPPASADVVEALAEMEGSALRFENGTVYKTGGDVDLGAIGKGYACDVVAEALRARNKSALVSVGGSIAALGVKPSGQLWQVGVRDPFSSSTSATLGTLSLSDAFVSTSGSYEKCFTYEGKTYHHILDPNTGMPRESDLVSVTVVAGKGTLSDILSTACFLLGSEAAFSLAAEYGASLVAVKTDGTLLVSEALRGVFTPKSDREVLYR